MVSNLAAELIKVFPQRFTVRNGHDFTYSARGIVNHRPSLET
jgi:hypothetical protein